MNGDAVDDNIGIACPACTFWNVRRPTHCVLCQSPLFHTAPAVGNNRSPSHATDEPGPVRAPTRPGSLKRQQQQHEVSLVHVAVPKRNLKTRAAQPITTPSTVPPPPRHCHHYNFPPDLSGDENVASALSLQDEYLALSRATHQQQQRQQQQDDVDATVRDGSPFSGCANNPTTETTLRQALSDQDHDLAAALLLQETLVAEAHTTHSTASAITNDHTKTSRTPEPETLLEDPFMCTGTAGRAWILVQRVLHLYERVLSRETGGTTATTTTSRSSLTVPGQAFQSHMVRTIASDDLVCLAERFLECHWHFQQYGKSSRVQIAYHYTYQQHLQGIVEDGGLLTAQERQQQGLPRIEGARRLHSFGSGIYATWNPFAFQNKYGDVGLMVAVLFGNTARGTMLGEDFFVDTERDVDTVVGNKHAQAETSDVPFFEELVLRRSCQCLPLIQFPSQMLDSFQDGSPGNTLVWEFHVELQKLMDDFFHNGVATPVKRVYPSQRPIRGPPRQSHVSQRRHMARGEPQVLPCVIPIAEPMYYYERRQEQNRSHMGPAAVEQVAPSRCAQENGPARHPAHPQRPPQEERHARKLHPVVRIEEIPYRAPIGMTKPGFHCSILRNATSMESCPICMLSLNSGDAIALATCHHKFHRECVGAALERNPRCPVCRKVIGEPQGTCPSGTMTIKYYETLKCGGYDGHGTIEMFYSVPSGIQLSYHPHPGQSFTGTTRKAYLPYSPEGGDLLERLRYAWKRGLTFTVGMSLTTGRDNSVVWTSIHHKTSLRGGPQLHGYPDPLYLDDCHEDLDALGVPPVEELVASPSQQD